MFVNGITDKYLLSIEGLCSITKDKEDAQLEVTCKTGDGEYKKHYLGISPTSWSRWILHLWTPIITRCSSVLKSCCLMSMCRLVMPIPFGAVLIDTEGESVG